MSFLYFAYGSNMLTKRMLINCPSARFKCGAELKNYKLLFSGYAKSWKGAVASITESEKDSVWGVIWEISKEHEEALNKQEAGYKAMMVPIHSGISSFLCKTYQKLSEESGCTPSTVYKTIVIEGAKEHNLPPIYIQHLESFPDNGYKGLVEIPVDIKI